MANVISMFEKLRDILDQLDEDWNKFVDKETVLIELDKWTKRSKSKYYYEKAAYLNIVYDLVKKETMTEDELHLARQIAIYYSRKTPYYVYRHTLPNGKVYIGITSQNPEIRWQSGFGYSDNLDFSEDIKKYGWDNIQHDILFDNLDEYDARMKEIELIKQYNSNNPEYGYNLDKGGKRIVKPRLWEFDRFKQFHKSRKIYKLVVESKDLDRLKNSSIYTMDIFYCEKLKNDYFDDLYLVKGNSHSSRNKLLGKEEDE